MPKKTSSTTSTPTTSNEQSLIGPNTTWNITFKWSEIEPIYNKTLAKVAKRLKSAGFRPGKVPPAIAAGMVGHEELAERTLQEIMPVKYQQSLEENKKKPLTRPSITITSAPLNEDWVVEVAIAEKPIIAVKGFEKTVKEAKKTADKSWTEHLKEHQTEKKADKSETAKPETTKEQLENEQREFTLQEIYKQLVVTFKPTIPELLLKEETQAELDYIVRQLQGMKMTLDDYLKHRKLTFEQLSTDLAMQVLGRVQLELVLDAIREETGTTTTDDDLEKYFARIADPKAREAQKANPEYKAYVSSIVVREKLNELLLKI